MKICFISPYEELTNIARDTAKDKGLDIYIVQAELKEVEPIADYVNKEGFDAIITRGATIGAMEKLTSIPVVSCDSTPFDIMLSLYYAKKITNNSKIGLLLYKPIRYGIENLEEVFDIEIVQKAHYENVEQIRKVLSDMKNEGIDVVIGGTMATRYCKEFDMQGVFLRTSAVTVSQSFNKALKIVRARKEEITKTERFRQILNFAYEGILVVDKEGKVVFFNPMAEKITKIEAKKILGKHISECFLSTKIAEIMKSGKEELGGIQSICSTKIITNGVPIKIDDEVQGVIVTFQDISKIQSWDKNIRAELYSKGLYARYNFDNYKGSSEQCKNVVAQAKLIAKSEFTVLIFGETGTGKEILAQSIHQNSSRKNGPFVAVNCSICPSNLLESELFGYEEGSFTGAQKGGRMGLFELAHQGTIFLDEIGELPGNVQAQLLRVIEEKQIRKIGSNKITHIDVRIIAATNKDLLEAVNRGDFRSDLYYRLNVLTLKTVPLRFRKDDIEDYVRNFMETHSDEYKLSPKSISMLKEYDWPGNVRELQNLLERIIILKGEVPEEKIIYDFISEGNEYKHQDDNGDYLQLKFGTLRDMEEQIIREAYNLSGGSVTKMSDMLGICRTTAWSKLKEIKIHRVI